MSSSCFFVDHSQEYSQGRVCQVMILKAKLGVGINIDLTHSYYFRLVGYVTMGHEIKSSVLMTCCD